MTNAWRILPLVVAVAAQPMSPVAVAQTGGDRFVPPDRPSGLQAPQQAPETLCNFRQIRFAGSCRRVGFFERLVTPGAVLVAVEGSRTDDTEFVAVLEAPNASTTRVRFVSTTKTGAMKPIGRNWAGDYEVLAELTTTRFPSEEGFVETFTTVDEVEDQRYQTTWYERVAVGGVGWRTHRWAQDLCTDVYGNAIYPAGEMCGPESPIASSGHGISDNCKLFGERQGHVTGAACTGVLVSVAAGGLAAAAAAAAMTGGASAPGTASLGWGGATLFAGGAASGALAGAGAAGFCNHVAGVSAANATMACDATEKLDLATAPGQVALALREAAFGGSSACGEAGGTPYSGPTGVVNAGSCADTATESEGSTNIAYSPITLGEVDSSDTNDVEEVTVYGERTCSPAFVEPGMCVVVSY